MKGTPAFSIYSATKAAVRNLALSWAFDLKGTGIRVNVLSPGAAKTPGLQNIAEAAGASMMFEALLAQTPAGRIANRMSRCRRPLPCVRRQPRHDRQRIFADGGMARV